MFDRVLTHYWLVFPFYTPWTNGFLMFSGGHEKGTPGSKGLNTRLMFLSTLNSVDIIIKFASIHCRVFCD